MELNENNEVITGVLNRDIALRPTGWRNVINDYYEESNNSIFYPRISIRLQVFLFLSQLMLMYAIKAISL